MEEQKPTSFRHFSDDVGTEQQPLNTAEPIAPPPLSDARETPPEERVPPPTGEQRPPTADGRTETNPNTHTSPPPTEPLPSAADQLTGQARDFFNRVHRSYQQQFHSRKCPFCLALVINERHKMEGSQRVLLCSNCGEELSSDFFKNKSHIVTLIGGPDSGKSVFITVLVEQVQQSSGMLNYLNAHAGILGKKGQDRFDANRSKLFVNRDLPQSHPTAAEIEKTPLVMRLSRQIENRTANMFIPLFDSSGEIFRSVEKLTLNYPHISNSDAIIYLIDPLNLQKVNEEIMKVEKYRNIYEGRNSNFTEDYNILNNVHEVFQREGRTDKQGKINIPVVFCLSKSDLLDSIATFYAPEEIDSDLLTVGEIIEDVQYTSEELEEYLQEYDSRLLNQIKSKFTRYAFFPVSPLGRQPDATKLKGHPEPRGVLHPLIWLLHQLKFMK